MTVPLIVKLLKLNLQIDNWIDEFLSTPQTSCRSSDKAVTVMSNDSFINQL